MLAVVSLGYRPLGAGGAGGWDWWAPVGAIVLFALVATARRRPPLALAIAVSAVGGLIIADLTGAWAWFRSGDPCSSLSCHATCLEAAGTHRFDRDSALGLNYAQRACQEGVATWATLARSNERSDPSPTRR